MIWEGDPADPTRKPPEMYTLIENFCLGLRRLELFARASCLRRGWISALMVGEEEKVPAAMAMAHEEPEPVVQSGPVLPAGLPQKPVAPALTNGFGEDVSIAAAQRWDRDAWDVRLAEWCQGERAVVPITPGKLFAKQVCTSLIRFRRDRPVTTKISCPWRRWRWRAAAWSNTGRWRNGTAAPSDRYDGSGGRYGSCSRHGGRHGHVR